MRTPVLLSCFCGLWLVALGPSADAADWAVSSRFYYGVRSGYAGVSRHWTVPITHPSAKIDPRIDPRLRHAATIADERANAHSKMRCWRYVKEALLAAGAVKSYPQTAYASEAGDELVRNYGFQRLSVRDPYSAPLGAVIVYGNRNRGHVEIRTKDGFASDYHSRNACFYPVLAVYGKFSSNPRLDGVRIASD